MCNETFAYNTTDGTLEWCCNEKLIQPMCYVLLDQYCVDQNEEWSAAINGHGEFKYDYCEELNPHWPHDHGTYQNLVNFGAVLLQGLGMLAMIFVALPTYLVDDKSKVVTSHPSGSIAKIAILQAVLYFYMIFGNYPSLCVSTKHSILPKLLDWIPIILYSK
jgi:hypothetical protein